MISLKSNIEMIAASVPDCRSIILINVQRLYALKKIAIIFLFFLTAFYSYAQTSIFQLEQLSKKFENTDLAKASSYARQALTIAQNKKDQISQTRILLVLGRLKRFESLLDSSRIYYEQALAAARNAELSSLEAESLNSFSTLERQCGRLPQAMASALEALACAEGVGDRKELAGAYYNIGYVLNMLDNYDSALLYHQKALAIRNDLNDPIDLAISYNGFGLVFMNMGDYDKARGFYNKAVSLINQNSNPRLMGMIYNNIGVTYENQGEFVEGRNFYFKSLEIKRLTNDKRGMAATYNNLGDNYREVNEMGKAIEYLSMGAKFGNESKALDFQMTSHSGMSFLYRQAGNYQEALDHYIRYNSLKDSLYNENKTRLINEYERKANQEKAQRVQMAEAQRIDRRNGMEYTAIAIFVMVLFVLLFYSRRRKISRGLANALLFISLLLMFEFLLVLTDSSVERITHGDPVLKLLTNVVLALLIFPAHTFLERFIQKRMLSST